MDLNARTWCIFEMHLSQARNHYSMIFRVIGLTSLKSHCKDSGLHSAGLGTDNEPSLDIWLLKCH